MKTLSVPVPNYVKVRIIKFSNNTKQNSKACKILVWNKICAVHVYL